MFFSAGAIIGEDNKHGQDNHLFPFKRNSVSGQVEELEILKAER